MLLLNDKMQHGGVGISRPVHSENFSLLSPWFRFYLLAACILLLTVVAYLSTMDAGFLAWDDRWVILDNPLMKTADGLSYFWFEKSMPDYLPLTFTSFWIEYQL